MEIKFQKVIPFLGVGCKTMQSDYLTYRGKCKELCEALIQKDPELKLIRGYYHCPMWGKQTHWWCVDPQGNIIDPSVKQFPTKGYAAEYEEFNGIVECSECGKELLEKDATFYGNYCFCNTSCNMRFVGL